MIERKVEEALRGENQVCGEGRERGVEKGMRVVGQGQVLDVEQVFN